MSDMNIAIMGAAGRMGRELIRSVHTTKGCQVAGGIEPSDSAAIGADLGILAGIEELKVPVTDDALHLCTKVDAIIDFTTPSATVEFAGIAANARIVHVIGTTGFSEKDEAAIAAAARHATIIKAGNMSLGINLLVELTKKVAAALDDEFDIEILEMHHRHKVDAPSGTAKMLGDAAANSRGVSLKDNAIVTREGNTGPRPRGHIGFQTLRGGGVIGDHTVIFASEGERVELTHRAGDRSIFATGAVRAALWGKAREPGLYSMTDVLGI